MRSRPRRRDRTPETSRARPQKIVIRSIPETYVEIDEPTSVKTETVVSSGPVTLDSGRDAEPEAEDRDEDERVDGELDGRQDARA